MEIRAQSEKRLDWYKSKGWAL